MFMRKTDADIKISIHALVKRATLFALKSFTVFSNFNPRPREEGDLGLSVSQYIDCIISIHALVKRATKRQKAV